MDLQAYYRQKRRAVFLKRSIASAFILAIFLLAFLGILWAPFFRIKNIDIKNYSDTAALRSKLQPHLGNFFLVSTAKIADLLKAEGFGLANVEKKFPKTLIVSFPETKPWLIWCPEENCFYVSESGIVADIAPKFSKNPLPEIILKANSERQNYLGENILSESQTRFLHVALDYLKSVGAQADKIEFQSGEEAKIFLKEGWFIYVSLGFDSQRIFTDFKLLLDEKIKDGRNRLEYVDLRFPNKAFYKFR